MSFREALDRNLPLERVGDVRLRFEESLLVGEARVDEGTWTAPLLAGGSVALGCGAALVALWPGGPLAVAALLGACAALSAYLAERSAFRRRYPRRFLLNFTTETLRLERAGRGSTSPFTELVPFDAVTDVRVVADGSLHRALDVHFEGAGSLPGQTRRLVSKVPATQAQELVRLERVLLHALGARRGEPESPGEPPVEDVFEPSPRPRSG